MRINSCPKIEGKFWCKDPDQPWWEAQVEGWEGGEEEKIEKGYCEPDKVDVV